MKMLENRAMRRFKEHKKQPWEPQPVMAKARQHEVNCILATFDFRPLSGHFWLSLLATR